MKPSRAITLTNLDVLAGFGPLQIVSGYRLDDEPVDGFPLFDLERVEPVFTPAPGFDDDVREVRKFEDLPQGARDYVAALEAQVGVPVATISVGPGRDQVIRR